MRRNELTAFLSTLGLSLAFSGLLAAQDPPSNSAQSTSKEKRGSPAKPKKTWTEDDVSALRSPADTYTDQKVEAQKAEAQKAEAQKASRTASSPEGPAPAANSPAPAGKSPALSNPKTVDSADKMIAWEERDIAAQEEHLDRLKIQLESASLDDRDRLQKLINEREKIIAETRKERDALVKQKSDLEKKGNASAAASPAEPPQ